MKVRQFFNEYVKSNLLHILSNLWRFSNMFITCYGELLFSYIMTDRKTFNLRNFTRLSVCHGGESHVFKWDENSNSDWLK